MQTKNLFERIALTIFVIFIFQTSFCQENYLSGFIISLNGDTVQGFIDYRNWENKPNEINFQYDINGEKVSYSPNDIKLFRVQDDIYVSSVVKRENSTQNINKLEYNPKFHFEIDTVFLQTLVLGEKSLYYCKNNNGENNFFIKQNNQFELLEYKKYLKKINGKSNIVENKKFVGQLLSYLNDCQSIHSRLSKVEYEKRSMKELFIFYHACTKSKIKFQRNPEVLSKESEAVKGIIVFINGKILQGFIDYHNWENNPKEINFQENIYGYMVLYSPRDIMLFQGQNEVYVSAVVKRENSTQNINKLEYNPKFHFEIDTVFLQTLVQGEKSLYYCKNNNGEDNFYIKQNNQFELLEYKKYLKKINGKLNIVENKKFVGQLLLYLNDCQSIRSRLNKVKYEKRSMKELFTFYHVNTKSKIKFQRKPEILSRESEVVEGIIISKNGDTLQGFIDYRNWENNPKEINFQYDINDEKVSYSPDDIKLFRAQGNIYVSSIVKRENSTQNINKLEYNPKFHFEIDTVFLQTLVLGEKSLYYCKNNNGENNFFIKQNNQFELLEYKKYLKKINGKSNIVENKKFVGQLLSYLNDCQSIHSRLSKVKYDKESLKKLFAFYQACDLKLNSSDNQEKIFVKIGIVAGMSISSVQFKGYSLTYLVNTDYPKSFNFSTGIYFDLFVPRNKLNRWSSYNELFYTSYKVEGKYKNIYNSSNYEIFNTIIGYSYIKMNNMFRYQYSENNILLYFNIGLSNGLVIAEKNYLKKETMLSGSLNIKEDKAIEEIRKYEQGYIFGLGTIYKNYSLELRYERGNGMSIYPSLNSVIRKLYFLLGYQF